MASPYLRTKLKPCWNEDQKQLNINLSPEIQPSIFKLFLRMIYGDINPSNTHCSEIESMDVLLLIKLAQLSSQYLITQLTRDLHQVIKNRFSTVHAIRIYLYFKSINQTADAEDVDSYLEFIR